MVRPDVGDQHGSPPIAPDTVSGRNREQGLSNEARRNRS
jgi:hypothetical protein